MTARGWKGQRGGANRRRGDTNDVSRTTNGGFDEVVRHGAAAGEGWARFRPRMGLTLRDLRLVAAIVDHGTLAAAATALHLTPAAVSRHLAELEARLHRPLGGPGEPAAHGVDRARGADDLIRVIDTTAVLLIVGTAFGWSALDVLRKLLAPHLSPLAVVFYLALGQVPVLALWGAATSSGPLTPRYLLVAGGSIALNIVANGAYVAALLRSPLSVSVPLLSLTPAFVATFARPLLGEWPRPVQLVGIALVVVGALLLGGAAAEGARWPPGGGRCAASRGRG